MVHAIAMVMGAVMVLIVVAQVIGRYVFQNNPVWIPELARFLSIWISLLLMGILIRDDRHLKVLILYKKASLDLKVKIRLVQLAGIFIFSLIFAYFGLVYTLTSGFQSVSPAMGLDLYVAYSIFPISGVLLMIFTVERIVTILRNPSIVEAGSVRPGGDDESIGQ